MAEIFLDDRKFIVSASVADDLQAALTELAQRRAADASTPEGEQPQPQPPSLVLLVVGDQEVYVSEAAAPALQALLVDHAQAQADRAELLDELGGVTAALDDARSAIASVDPLHDVLDWMEATGHFVRADPDGRVRVYNLARPGRCPKGTHLSGHAIATLPAPPE